MPKITETKPAKPPAKRDATQEELVIAYSGPAMASNRFFVNVGPAGVRIAFTEQQGPNPTQFRTAVMLSAQDAVALKDLLEDLLEDAEEQIAAAAKENG